MPSRPTLCAVTTTILNRNLLDGTLFALFDAVKCLGEKGYPACKLKALGE